MGSTGNCMLSFPSFSIPLLAIITNASVMIYQLDWIISQKIGPGGGGGSTQQRGTTEI